MSSIFLSYRREDASGWAGRLTADLRRRIPTGTVFQDISTIEIGEDFHQAIEQALQSCAVVLVMIGPGWLTARDRQGRRRLDDPNDVVRAEVAAALQRTDLKVIPLLVGGAAMVPAEDLPDDVRPIVRRHALELSDSRWDHDVGVLVQHLGGVPTLAKLTAHRPRGLLTAASLAAITLAIALAGMWFGSRSPPEVRGDKPVARPEVKERTTPASDAFPTVARQGESPSASTAISAQPQRPGVDRPAQPAASEGRAAAAKQAIERRGWSYSGETFVVRVAKGDVEGIQLFLEAGIDPNAVDRDHASALMWAAGNGDRNTVQALLRAGASITLKTRRGTALDWASSAGHDEIVALLVSAVGQNAINEAFVTAAGFGHKSLLLLLKDRGAQVDKVGAEALTFVARYDNLGKSESAERDTVLALLDMGVEINARDQDGATALMYAAERGRKLTFHALLERGADVSLKCECRGWSGGGWSALSLSLRGGHGEIADALIASGADVNAISTSGRTPLIIAVENSMVDPSTVSRLLAKGADPKAKDKEGRTALAIARSVPYQARRDALLALLEKTGL
jgi:ankyrin repeat protein